MKRAPFPGARHTNHPIAPQNRHPRGIIRGPPGRGRSAHGLPAGDADLLAHAPRLRCVSLLSTGYNVVDIPAAQKAGVSVCHVREYCTDVVADHTMALLLALERNLRPYISQIEQGIWEFDRVARAPRLGGQILCLFGLGKISRAVIQRASAFGFQIQVVSHHATPEEAAALGPAW